MRIIIESNGRTVTFLRVKSRWYAESISVDGNEILAGVSPTGRPVAPMSEANPKLARFLHGLADTLFPES